jgi:hypothetical protein
MQKLLRELYMVVVLPVLAFLLLWRLAHFSLMQSAAIVIAFAVYAGMQDEQHSRGRVFMPYRVTVEPNFERLLIDYKLVRDDPEELRRFRKVSGPTRFISFTVLQPRHDVDMPRLIFHDTRKCFVTGTDFEEPIRGIGFKDPLEDRFQTPEVLEENAIDDFWMGIKPQGPKVRLQCGPKGYEIGHTLREAYWRRVCATGEAGDLARTEADTDSYTGTTRLVVATLPYSALDTYYPDLEFDYKDRDKQERMRGEQLAEYGWKRGDRHGSRSRLEHRYFTVEHCYI